MLDMNPPSLDIPTPRPSTIDRVPIPGKLQTSAVSAPDVEIVIPVYNEQRIQPAAECHTPAPMRALVQRVSRATVSVDGNTVAEIGPGLLILLGVAREDRPAAADRLAEKVRALRIFADADGNMNEALGERQILCVSQFTLYGDARRGNRPSFMAAAPSEQALGLYERFCERSGALRGVFGAHMDVELVNDGPVTLMLEA
jgi:D-tyrosyl-tRNA(Tyr) deacylase